MFMAQVQPPQQQQMNALQYGMQQRTAPGSYSNTQTPVHSRVPSQMLHGSPVIASASQSLVNFPQPISNATPSPLSPQQRHATFAQSDAAAQQAASSATTHLSNAQQPQHPAHLARPLPQPLPPIRDRVVAFYKKYNPSKLGNVNQILESYAGHEDQLMVALVQKYGPEDVWWGGLTAAPIQAAATPPITPSGAAMQIPVAASNSFGQQGSFAQRLAAILQRHDPAKMNLIPQMLQAFKGNEENLLFGLQRKYSSAQPLVAATSVRPAVGQPPITPSATHLHSLQGAVPAGLPSGTSAQTNPSAQNHQQQFVGSTPVPNAQAGLAPRPAVVEPTKLQAKRPPHLGQFAAITVSDSDEDEEVTPSKPPQASCAPPQATAQENDDKNAPAKVTAAVAGTEATELTPVVLTQPAASEPSQAAAALPPLAPMQEQTNDTTSRQSLSPQRNRQPASGQSKVGTPPMTPTEATVKRFSAATGQASAPVTPRSSTQLGPAASPGELKEPRAHASVFQRTKTPERPLTERRTSRDGIVVAPVLLLGDEPPRPNRQQRNDTHNASSQHASHTTSQLPLSAHASLSDIPWTESTVQRTREDGDVHVGARHRFGDDRRHNVSVSPLSGRSSPVSDYCEPQAKSTVTEQQVGVGCESSTSLRNRAVLQATNLSQVRSSRPESKTNSTGLEDASRRGVSSNKSGVQLPLWVNPSAKGVLSTAYERSRSGIAQQDMSASRRSRSADVLASRLYSPKPDLVSVSDTKPATPASRRVATSPCRTSSKPTSSSARRPSPPVATNRTKSAVTQTDPEVLVAPPKKEVLVAPPKKVVAAAREQAVESPRVLSPVKKKSADLNNMLYREISRPSTVSTEMDVIVVDLRKDFKPNIHDPPDLEYIKRKRRTHSADSLDQQHRAINTSTTSKGTDEGPAVSSQAKPPHPTHRVILLEHVPAELPFDMYSTFRSASKKGAPSAWARAPTKVGLFDPSPRRGRGEDASHQRADGEATSIRYDEMGRRIRVIRDAPTTKESIEAQKLLCHRLSAPKPLYMRIEDNV